VSVPTLLSEHERAPHYWVSPTFVVQWTINTIQTVNLAHTHIMQYRFPDDIHILNLTREM